MRLTLLLCLASAASAHAATPGLLGDWTTPVGSIVRVEPCASSTAPGSAPPICLRIVQLSPSAPVTKDVKNPDANLRSRPLCGLVIGTDFQETDPTHLHDGHLYDPLSGHTYEGTITASGADLKLRGYIGNPIFGRSETWHRSAPVTACH